MGVGTGIYMYVVVVQKFTFAISSPVVGCASMRASVVTKRLNGPS